MLKTKRGNSIISVLIRTLFFSIMFSIIITSSSAQTGTEVAGTFTTVNNAPPNTVIVGIMDDDTDDCGDNRWDKTANTTHMTYVFGPVLNWTEGVDTNGDGISTRI